MNITNNPNIKPFRDYSEHNVLNLFSHVDASVNKGSFVSIVEFEGNTNVWQDTNDPATPHLKSVNSDFNEPSRATVLRDEVSAKVKNAEDGEAALGMTLVDVREYNKFGERYDYRPRTEKYENDIVTSGEAVPIVTKGVFKINGFVGTPAAGSGAVISTTEAGKVDVTADPTALGNVGKFLSSPDADGYAFFKLEL